MARRDAVAAPNVSSTRVAQAVQQYLVKATRARSTPDRLPCSQRSIASSAKGGPGASASPVWSQRARRSCPTTQTQRNSIPIENPCPIALPDRSSIAVGRSGTEPLWPHRGGRREAYEELAAADLAPLEAKDVEQAARRAGRAEEEEERREALGRLVVDDAVELRPRQLRQRVRSTVQCADELLTCGQYDTTSPSTISPERIAVVRSWWNAARHVSGVGIARACRTRNASFRLVPSIVVRVRPGLVRGVEERTRRRKLPPRTGRRAVGCEPNILPRVNINRGSTIPFPRL